MNANCRITFIIPVYNEEDNISHVLADIHKVIAVNSRWQSEVIVIEDGSSDNTKSVLLKEIAQYPETHLILHEKNQGYTRSLKDGIAKARGRYLMYIRAHEKFDCSEIPSFIEPLLSEQADIVLGVRWQRNAYKLFRFFLSIIYIFFLNYLFKLRVNDYNWSQAWSRDLLNRIELKSKSLFVLPEIIIKAHDLKYRIKEVPSNHRGRRAGKCSGNIQIMGCALLEAFKFWWHRKSNGYQAAQ